MFISSFDDARGRSNQTILAINLLILVSKQYIPINVYDLMLTNAWCIIVYVDYIGIV